VCAPSKWLAEWVEEKYKVDCVILPNGVDTHLFAPRRESQGLDNVVLYVGKLVQKKGVKELFEAARALPQYEFWLVGDPTITNIQVPSLPNIKLVGFVDHDSISSYFSQASLCVFPSHWETFSLVGLEAMACGRAIIATGLGFSEYVENEHNGLLIAPRRPDQLIRSIRYLMEDENTRKRFERNAREKALQYDWEIIIQRYKKLYDQLQ
jgi:glycosyltransferase involved in cell wall biosynthesis